MFMKNFKTITATLHHPELLEDLVEQLANRRDDIGYSSREVPKNWRAVETSATEAYVRGTLSFSGVVNNKNASIGVAFLTSMLFTCIKAKDEDYKVLWSSSLS